MDFPGDTAHLVRAYTDVIEGDVPRVRAMWTGVRIARRVPASSAVGDAFRSRPARIEPSAFHRVSQRPPLRRHLCWSPLPRACARFGPASPDAALVPPSPFLPASTASSSCRFAGLLRPASDHGVHRVATLRCRMPATPSAFSHRCPPFRASPSREAVLASPRALAPLSFNGDAVATSRPCSARESVATRVRGRTPSPDALLGFPSWSPTRTCAPTTRERMGRSHQGPARRQADPVASSMRPAPPPPEGSDHAGAWGRNRSGRHHCRATMPGNLRPSVPPPKRCPHRSAPGTTSSSGPTTRRPARSSDAGGTTHPRARAPHVHSELSVVPSAARIRSPKRPTPSAPPRSVRSAAAVEGVCVADGLIGSRSVAQGRASRAKTPASARRRDVPSYVSTARVRSVARAALLRRVAVPNVGV